MQNKTLLLTKHAFLTLAKINAIQFNSTIQTQVVPKYNFSKIIFNLRE